MFKLRKTDFYALFLITLLIGEFYYISIYSGYVRLYHLLAILIVLFFITSVYRLLNSSVFLAILAFILVNSIAIFFSDSPSEAALSFLSFLIYLIIAIAVALIMIRNKITIARFMNITLVLTIISVIWGVIQILVFKISGISLALSEAQDTQIQIGFGPAFRQEANGFGKFLIFPFLLFLPSMLKNPKSKKLKVAFLIMGLGIIMNFTRTAIIGIGVAFLFAIWWYSKQGMFSLLMKRTVKIFMGVFLAIMIVFLSPITISDYGKYKIENLFNAEETIEGESSKYRLETMQTVLETTLADNKRILIGNGWGQTYVVIREQLVQAGGADWVNILGYSGVSGLIFYFIYSLTIFFVFVKALFQRGNDEYSNFVEGMLLAYVGLFTTSLLSGFMIYPEYWIVVGVSIYIGVKSKLRPRTRRFNEA